MPFPVYLRPASGLAVNLIFDDAEGVEGLRKSRNIYGGKSSSTGLPAGSCVSESAPSLSFILFCFYLFYC